VISLLCYNFAEQMKRVLYTYFTFFLILFSGISAFASISKDVEGQNSFTIYDLIEAEQQDLQSQLNAQGFQYVKTPLSNDIGFEIKAIDDIEVEEYEWVSVKKIIESNKTFTVLFYTLFSDFSFKEDKVSIHYFKDSFSQLSVHPLYVTFCVYRI